MDSRKSALAAVMARVVLTVLFAVIALTGTALAQTTNKPAFTPPTATELFELRGKCAELGNKFKAGLPDIVISLESHFNELDDRCYLKLIDHFSTTQTQTALYDGQTQEMIAHVEEENGKPFKGGFGNPQVDAQDFSYSFDEKWTEAQRDEQMKDDVLSYIDAKMTSNIYKCSHRCLIGGMAPVDDSP
jgi:hypothetical protein